MFVTLLLVTFAIAAVTASAVVLLFNRPISTILNRVVSEPLGAVWKRYILFATYVVGISGGVRIWDLEKYITPRSKDEVEIVLNENRWILEAYRTVISTLQSVAWMLLVFFLFALIAYVLVRGLELRAGKAVKEELASPAA